MSSGSGGIPDPLRRSLEQGLEAAFAVDSLSQLADAVDFEGLAAGDPDAMDFERMGELVGQMGGRLVVKRTVGRFTPGQLAEQTVGYAIGGAIGREGGRLILSVVEDQRGDPIEVDIEVEEETDVEEFDEFTDLDEEDGDDEDEGFEVDIGGPEDGGDGDADDGR